MNEHIKFSIDAAAVLVWAAALAKWLPAIAALISIVWSLIRIYETNTVQGWLNKLRRKRGVDKKAP